MSKHGAHSRAIRPDQEGDAPARFDRRRFLAWTAAGGVVAAGAAIGIAESTGSGEHSDQSEHRANRPTSATSKKATSALPDGAVIPTSAAILAENAKTGHAWWVTTPQNAGDIEGFASQVSAEVGDKVTLFVSTKAPQFHVEAYRAGYYQGIGARLVWQSAEVPGIRQPSPALLSPTNTIQCNWAPSLTVTIGRTWPPGAYLLKLVGTGGEQQFVPLCVRDDASKAAVVIQQSVTTWQAYNRWGGYSLYYGNADGELSYTHAPAGGTYDDRARIVSFDRPYDHDWASGAADFVGNEFPVVFHAEKIGLDVTYWTDVDLHVQPQLLAKHRMLVSLGHDEYWSQSMRDGAAQALAGGVNLAFLGANACYRQIRFQSSAVGPNRHQVCYKSAAEDPMTGQNDALVTVNWAQSPVSRPESQLIGSTYQDIEANADMVIADGSSWVLAGSGLTSGQHLAGAVRGEFDRYVPNSASPTNLDVVAHSIVPNRGGNYSDVTWYTVSNGGGVFATGDASWVGQLSDSPLVPPNVLPSAESGVTPALLRIMENVYSVLGAGPAALSHPSQGNWRTIYTPGSASVNAPNTQNSA
jgi:N,N-dimethylformamidase beta subunit-like, C-terminal